MYSALETAWHSLPSMSVSRQQTDRTQGEIIDIAAVFCAIFSFHSLKVFQDEILLVDLSCMSLIKKGPTNLFRPPLKKEEPRSILHRIKSKIQGCTHTHTHTRANRALLLFSSIQ